MESQLKVPRLYELVVEQIYDWVRKGEIRPGDRFPSERELEERLGVSRAVLREAFYVLESRGLVYSRHGKGRFLRHLEGAEVEAWLGTPRLLRRLEVAALLDIYEVRMAMETRALEMAAERASDAEIGAVARLYETKREEWSKVGVTETDFELHCAYAEACHNFMWEQVIRLQLRLIAEFSAPEFSRLIVEHSPDDYIRDHGAIVKALVNRDGRQAARVMAAHLERTVQMARAL